MATKVLVFESDPAFAGELRNELGKLGCATTVVDDGNVGLQQASTDRPDLILLSIELPRMNGFSVCNKLKKDANLKDVPLIIMSSESSDETFEQHKKLRTRAEDYVHKPVAFGELLRHIQVFIPLGSIRPPDGDSAIVIDDDIELGATDYMSDDEGTQIAPRPPVGMQGTHSQRAAEAVDADVDAFADAAFGRLTEPPAMVAPPAEPRPAHNNGVPDSTSQTVPRRPSSPVVAARPVSSRPTATIDVAEHEKLREELARTRGRATALETEVSEARNEVERWRLEAGEAERLARELEELKVKLASVAPRTSGISSREFLDLREALNKKDKEILSLKEAASRKDKEHVESQDRALALERAKSDLDEKTLALEREAAENKDKIDALTVEVETAKKTVDDVKGRLDKARGEIEAKDRQLGELKAKHGEELASNEAKLAAARSEFDQSLANERAEHARALDQAEERRKADLDQAKRDREAALLEARELADKDKQEALAEQSAQLKQAHDGKMAGLHRAHQQELDKLRAESEKAAKEALEASTAELAAAKKQGEDDVARTRSEAQAHETEALEALRAELTQKINEIENDRDSRIAAIESRYTREVSEANDKLAKADMDLSAARGELGEASEAKRASDAAHEAALADLQERLTQTIQARDDFEKKYGAASDRVGTLEAELVSTTQELSETKQKLASESARAEKAQAKWAADRQSLERAKDALAVALSQIEDAEGRPLE